MNKVPDNVENGEGSKSRKKSLCPQRNPMDSLIRLLGSPGRYQIIIYILLCLNQFPISLNFQAMSIFGTKVPGRCKGLDDNATISNDRCSAYTHPNNHSLGVETCTEFEAVYSGAEFPIAAEWNLVCSDSWYVRMAQTIWGLGIFVGGLIFGILGDIYGRRPVLLMTLYSQAVLGVIITVTKYFYVFVVLKFIQGMLLQGLQTMNNALIMELFETRYRTKAGMILTMIATSCSMVIGFMGWLLTDWKHLQLAISAPTAITIFFIWVLPESLRWLLTNQRSDAALQAIQKQASFNKCQLPPDIETRINDVEKVLSNVGKPAQASIKDLFAGYKITTITVTLFYLWFTASIIYYGITFSLPDLSGIGNRYLSFVIAGALETVARFIGYFIISRVGRKHPLVACFLLTGILNAASGGFLFFKDSLSPSVATISTVLAILGRVSASMCFAFLLVLTSEVFPTVLRTGACGACSSSSRVGTALAPQMLYMNSIFTGLPFVVFGALAVGAGALTFLLPETSNVPLPDTITDAKNIIEENPADEVTQQKNGLSVDPEVDEDHDTRI